MDDVPFQSGQKMKLPPRMPRKPTDLAQKRTYTGEANDNIYFGSPGMTSVVEEVRESSFPALSNHLTRVFPSSHIWHLTAKVRTSPTLCPVESTFLRSNWQHPIRFPLCGLLKTTLRR